MLTRYDLQWSRFFRVGVLVASVLFFMGLQGASAQQFTVEGTVLDAETGNPLPGVNVRAVGTQRGTATNVEGRFEMQVSDEEASLRFSFVGFQTKTVSVDGRSEITVELQPQAQELEGVVVTALGIERQQRSVGYSVSKVSGGDVAEVPTPNFGDALSGKVAGVNVSNTATGPGGSSNVLIRGISTLTGNNQPLYVVDGVPLDNSNLAGASMWGGSDMGDGLTSLNPQDIEDVSVLKGAAAAALYGERASNGVVLISTKTGSAGGLGVEFSSTTTAEKALDYYDSFQSQYGHGIMRQQGNQKVWKGVVPTDQSQARGFGLSAWGAKMSEVESAVEFDGKERPYSPATNNIGNFYRTGINSQNTIALNGGGETSSFRLSMSHRRDQSIVPNSNYNRTTFLARASSELGVPGLSADVKANYVRENAKNRPRVSDAPGNPNYVTSLMPPSMNIGILSPGWVGDNKFDEQLVTESIFVTNPYWAVNRFSNTDTDDRLNGYIQLQYEIGNWVTLQGRGEIDTYWTNRQTVEPYGTNYIPRGSFDDTEYNVSEYNYSFEASTTQSITSSISMSARLGGNVRQNRSKILGQRGTGFNIPGLQTIGNTSTQSPIFDFSESEVWSAYATADVSYNDYLFLNFSGRNDIASTLPVDNNSYFYPSLSGSFVFSDAFEVPDWLSYGKVRGAWGFVGGDTSPYSLNLAYQLTGHTHTNPNGTGVPVGEIATGSVPNAQLQPSQKETVEAGLELGFFSDRVTLDFTWYRETTTDDIVPTTIPATSGYTSRILNVGKTRNSGVEIALQTTPLQTEDFEWNLDLNASQNNNEVIRITEDLNSLQLSQPRSRNAFVRAREGEPYGAIMAYKFKRDDQGRLILDNNGLPQRRDSLTVAGHFPPDWRGGISNTFSYKGFVLKALMDVQIGGSIFSGTNNVATANGLHEQTLRGREQGYVEVSGVDSDGNETTARVSPQTYWGRISTISDEFVYDASYVKLRELRFGYRFSSLLEGLPVQSANIAVTARNLWIFHKNVPNVDPESTYNRSTQQQGLEYFGVPQTRSLGMSLNLRF